MPEENPNPVIVAVGTDPMASALRFAVTEARRAGCGVHLVHAVHHVHDGPEFVLVTESDHERLGRQVLGAALEEARDYAEGVVPVTCELVMGAPVPALVAAGDDGRMLVLAHRDLSRVKRFVTRSITSGVAARARVPVVSVPQHWAPGRFSPAEATVVVGVDVPERSEELLRMAVHLGAARLASVQVVHAWQFANSYSEIGASREDEERRGKQTAADIQHVLDGLGDVVTGVPIHIDVRHARAADTLVEASNDTDLVVIGPHDPLVPVGSHVGPVARALLQAAECPVLIAGTRPHHR
jgi:nucleotide-binding universal stress UspA family protein